jgi:hypothetical protein
MIRRELIWCRAEEEVEMLAALLRIGEQSPQPKTPKQREVNVR